MLLFQRAIQGNDLLIIEEPESHLHPASQVALARVLFKASRGPLFIFLTTHSDFFLSEINNLLRESLLRRPDDGVVASAYWMNKSDDGSRLTPLDIDDVDGIPEESFTEVAMRLYDEQVEQQVKLVGGME